MENKILIRNAQETDLEDITKICHQFKEELTQHGEQYFRKFLKNCYAFYVVEFNENVIGYATVLDENSLTKNKLYHWFKKKLKEFLYAEQIAISREYHRKGIGSALLNRIFESGKPTCLDVFFLNVHAINFYKKLGFEQMGFVKLKNNKSYAMLIKKAG